MQYATRCLLASVLLTFGSPCLLTGTAQGLRSSVPDAADLHDRLDKIGCSFANGGAASWDAAHFELPSRLLEAALIGVDFEAIPVEAGASLKKHYFLVNGIAKVATPDDGELWRITGQIASPENGCLVWRRAAFAAIYLQGTWRIGGPVVELPLSHAAQAPCIKGTVAGGATQLPVAAEPAQRARLMHLLAVARAR